MIVKTVKSGSSAANSSKSSRPSIQTLHQEVQNFRYTLSPESANSSRETILPSKSGNSKAGAVLVLSLEQADNKKTNKIRTYNILLLKHLAIIHDLPFKDQKYCYPYHTKGPYLIRRC